MSSQRVPLVALVGRPNVGKSTLFNRLLGRRVALVDDQPGVTRDRLFGEAVLSGHMLRFVDTGGIESNPKDNLMQRVREQTQLAIEEADLVVFVLDSESGPNPADTEVAKLLRKAAKPTVVVGNKADLPQHDSRVYDLYELGFKEVLAISAEHARGIDVLVANLIERLDPPLAKDMDLGEAPINVEDEALADAEDAPSSRIEWQGGPIRVAVVGRPNVGKSSLINRLLGEERHLATPLAGTTRDAVDSELMHGEQRFVLTDTAGIRRKRSIADRLEKFAVMMAMRGLDGADVALVVFDAAEPPSDQDARIVSMAEQRGKGIILVANKWDLIPGTEEGTAFEEHVRRQLAFCPYAPLVRVSAKTGRGLDNLLKTVIKVQEERHRRVSTGELNRFFRDAVEHSPPPMLRGRRPRLYFVSQPLVRPPTFVFTASHPEDIRDSYSRYLTNSLRKRYGFEGTPLWVKFRGKSKKS